MIGKNVIEISAKDFLNGMTSSPETDDGGFSPETSQVNIGVSNGRIGVLYPPAFKSDKGTSTGEYIASCADPDAGIGVYRYLLTTTGKFYSVDGSSTQTLRQTGAISYIDDYTDMTVYRNALYATSATNITLGTGANLTAIDEDWWTTVAPKSGGGFPSALTTGIPHPLLVFEDNLWIGDGQKLHKWDGASNLATEGFLTLNTGLVITALGVDSSTGKMLISATDGINTPGVMPRQAKIYVYDGFSNKPSRSVIVDDVVTSIYPFGGTVFMCYGKYLGYWNGSGITFLRKFRNVTVGTDKLVYKQRVTNIGKKLIFADGADLLTLEETLPGKRVFYVSYAIGGTLNSRYDIIFNLGSDNIGMCWTSTGPVYEFGVLNLETVNAPGLLVFVSKKYNFQRPVKIREILTEYADTITNNTTTGYINLYNQDGIVINNGLNNTNTSGETQKHILLKYNTSTTCTSLQLRYENTGYTSTIAGIRRFLISYDVVE